MGKNEDLARLAGVVAKRMASLQSGASGGSRSAMELSGLLDVLELFLPRVLLQDFAEWETESLDGFLVARAETGTKGFVGVAGLAILISEQTVTLFQVGLLTGRDGSLQRAEVLLGEPGGGPLGISGPVCTSSAVVSLLDGLVPRLSQVDWVYRSVYVEPSVRHSGDS